MGKTDAEAFHGYIKMADLDKRYDIRTAAAWVLGHARRTGNPVIPEILLQKTVDECSVEEQISVVSAGIKADLKLYPFKFGGHMMARTRRTLGFLHSISFETMLDVGSGRGAFLIPFVKEFPWVRITSLDLLENRVLFLRELADGGFGIIHAELGNICDQPYPDEHFDVVTMLEVLEHIPAAEKAVESAVRMAKQYVVVTVPSKPDNNPEHIHLFTKEKLTQMFETAGCTRLHFDGVEGHLFMIATVGER